MLYPKNAEKELSEALFSKPTSEYRAAPFWAWNSELLPEHLTEQIEIFKRMGMGGFFMHCRTGLTLPYMQEDFLNRIALCVEKARKEDMLAWLYDEDRWPSGFAGGLVTQDEQYRARYLRVTPWAYGDSSAPKRPEKGRLLARYAVTLEEGRLAEYTRLTENQDAPEQGLWCVYCELQEPTPWFNNQTYVDTLSKKAINRFIEETHEKYKAKVGADFGGIVPAIFTDEPQFSFKTTLGFAQEKKDVILPYTEDFDATYQDVYGVSFFETLPELLWDLPEGVSVARYRYHEHVAERFASGFADTVGEWCAQNGLMLTGHMMEEPTLHSQTAALGDAMRSYRSFQLPGIDMLCGYTEYTTAKQAQSAAHQYGRPGVLSELYGVTNWDYDFRGHKIQGDWQSALGVTVRVPHLSWLSMEGEAKRDYPASIGYQSPWWTEYEFIEDHHARVTAALTRGTPSVRIGVVHPVESYWLHWGPSEQTAALREEMDKNFGDITEWLITSGLDFDFICESLLPEQCPAGGNPLQVGQMAYDAVVVPDCLQLRSTTLDRLEAFVKAGGTLIFAGEIAAYADAQPCSRPQALAEHSVCVPFRKTAILEALEPFRSVDLLDNQGNRTQNLITQTREDGQDKWLFIAQKKMPENPDVSVAQQVHIRMKGEWNVMLYDTLSGQIQPLTAVCDKGWTTLAREFYGHDSLLLKYTRQGKAPEKPVARHRGTLHRFEGKVPVTLSEPNVLVLDRAEYAFDGGAWQRKEEVLKIDNAFRKYLGWPLRGNQFAQPWVVKDEPAEHILSLRFTVDAQVGVSAPELAMERAETCRIWMNGQEVPSTVKGWYVDKSIKTVALPPIPAGESLIEVRVPITRRMGAEWCYLIGDFGVHQSGSLATLTAPVRELTYGDWTRQGLAFYGGNVTYHIPFNTHGSGVTIKTPQYRGALVGVQVDGKPVGRIVLAPYELNVENIPAGPHRLDLTVYGSRVNSFGQLHLSNPHEHWFGPGSWRSEGDCWSDEYRLKDMGLLIAPWLIR